MTTGCNTAAVKTGISARNLSKYYWLFDNDFKKIPWLFTHKGHSWVKKAVRDVTFEIEHGEIVGVIGKNGAGKSTLLKLIAGITLPTSGSFFIDGKVTSLINLRAGFISDFTGIQNLRYKASLMGFPSIDLEDRLEEILAFADIGDYVDLPIKTYSSGMQARLGFALAAFSDPDVLIVDEIFAVGDRDFRKKSAKKTAEMIQSGKTVLIVSHSEEMLKNYCDRVLYMHDGEIRFDGPTDRALSIYNQES